MLSNYKKYLSFFYPLHQIKMKGEYHDLLEITWVNGKMVLNSKYANYSYGSLHQVFIKAFRHFNFTPKSEENILILGFGAGSVYNILRQDFSFEGKITGVERDATIISIARKYFRIPEKNSHFELIHQDAFLFVKTCEDNYATIIVDLFVELNVPEHFLQSTFIAELKRILQNNGCIFFNIIQTSINQLSMLTDSIKANYLLYTCFEQNIHNTNNIVLKITN